MYISSKGIRISAKPSAVISLLTGLLGGSRIYEYKNHCFQTIAEARCPFFPEPQIIETILVNSSSSPANHSQQSEICNWDPNGFYTCRSFDLSHYRCPVFSESGPSAHATAAGTQKVVPGQCRFPLCSVSLQALWPLAF